MGFINDYKDCILLTIKKSCSGPNTEVEKENIFGLTEARSW
tara:strand:+ start:2802 stop:2924 length:123 start_codon:yes stop_codon:yes gene_type:complete